MILNRRFFCSLALLILLGVGVGAEEEASSKPERPIPPSAWKENSWRTITPHPRQNKAAKLIDSPPRQVELEKPTAPRQGREGWWIGPIGGVIWGRAREIVFDDSGVRNQNDYLSELLWDLKHVPLLGIKSDWRGKKANHLRMEFSFAIPNMPVGKMEDYDWIYTDRDWSHWSLSSVRLRWGFIFDASYEEMVVSSGFFKLKLGFGYHMDWWGWKNEMEEWLHSSFAEWDGRRFPDKFNSAMGDKFRDNAGVLKTGINYTNYFAMYFAPLLTIRGSFEWDAIALGVLGRVGPVLGVGKNHHPTLTGFGPNGAYFNYFVLGGPWVDTSLEVELRINHRFLLSLRGEFAWLNETRGLRITVPTKGKTIYLRRKKGGIAFRRVGVNVFALWKLGGPRL